VNAIRVEGLVKRYGDVSALDGLDLEVEADTIFGFLGPNGAGKTTTIRILTGLARPDAGSAQVAGVQVGREDGRLARAIGHLPEEPAFYPWMTPAEFLDYCGRLFGLEAAERVARTQELLALVGLEGDARRRIGGFSRGMRQRLGIAQALVNRPPVIFLDEPASALDPAGRRDVLEMISGLKSQATVFMSSHILADVARVCDTVGIIDAGKMRILAPLEALLDRYALPVFEVEGLPGLEAELQSWADGLSAIPWVDSVRIEAHTARVQVKDLDQARTGLISTIADAGLAINRFEAARPSLEDIFLKLVGEEGKP
jgi:ABC-2 type transport system ATP-binding protein